MKKKIKKKTIKSKKEEIVRPEYLKKLKKIMKGKFIRFKNVDELRKYIEKKEEDKKFLTDIQKSKMKELWDNKEDEEWE